MPENMSSLVILTLVSLQTGPDSAALKDLKHVEIFDSVWLAGNK